MLVGATLVPITALGWLAARILQQERDLDSQRAQDSLRYAAGKLALSVNSRLAGIEEQLAQGRGLLLDPEGIEPLPDAGILYQPGTVHPMTPPPDAFATAEVLEYQRADLAGAAREYRRLSDSPDRTIRAAALVRLGAVLRKQTNTSAALDAYAQLQRLGTLLVDDSPAEWIARQSRCRIFEKTGDRSRLAAEAAGLARAVYSGRARVERSTFLLYQDMLRNWGAPSPGREELGRTEAALALWREWRANGLAPRGRRIVNSPDGPVLALWSGGPDRPAVWLAASAAAEAAFGSLWKEQGLVVSIFSPDGELFFGPGQSGVALTPGETHLPFILHAAWAPGRGDPAPSRMRTRLLLSGLALTFAVMIAAAYGLYRAVTREMALARQQSEFVSTVSHEFRTPLTSMRHLTELLATNSVASDERKATYYQLIARETERLHRMVESLLSFGRMQAGAYAWRLESTDARQLVNAAVEEFRREWRTGPREVVCESAADLPPIHADYEALSRAVSNLLENAEKYSPPGTAIHVRTCRDGRSVQISVEDQGLGIPRQEQKQLFRKFVRGAEARRAGIRGIGVGLALVKSVAEAHGGSVKLSSEPGRGSTFTLVIPCQES
jgi:signal transduction histidine kinase